jgi:transglutaminase-like putative cysteine protease
VPDWVQQAAHATLPTYPANTKAVKLYEEAIYTVTPDGKTMMHYREAIKILRPQGREYANLISWYQKDSKINYMHAWSIGPDGHFYALNDKEITEEGVSEGGILYDDVRVKIAKPPAADVNAVVAYEFEQQLPRYFSEQSWEFQESIPTHFSAMELDLPSDWKYYAAWSSRAPIAPNEMTPNHLRWEMRDVEGIDLEDVPLAPSGRALAERMVVHYSPSELPKGDDRWAAIGNWYDELASKQTESSSEIANTARGLGGQDFYEKLAKVADFMQRNIRYVGIEVGIGGWKPHPAGDVFHYRYGDCKDKATLLISMLGAVGVRATYVMVDTHRGLVNPSVPSVFGNHMIAAIELPAGYSDRRLQAVVRTRSGRNYLIFDPTDEYTRVGELRWQLQGSYGVLVNGPNSELVKLPKLGPDVDVLERSGKFELAGDGTLRGTIVENRAGMTGWSLRALYARDGEKRQREALERILKGDFSSLTLGTQVATNARDLDKHFTLNYDLTAASYAKSMGNLLLVRPRVLGTHVEPLNDKPRKYPIDLRQVGTWRDNFDVKIPSGYAVDELPDPINVDVGFATYNSKVSAEGNLLHYSREYVVKEQDLSPEKYKDLKRIQGAIVADERVSAVLKKQ